MGQTDVAAAAALASGCDSQRSGATHAASFGQVLAQRRLNHSGQRQPDIECLDVSFDRLLQIVRYGHGCSFDLGASLASVGAIGEGGLAGGLAWPLRDMNHRAARDRAPIVPDARDPFRKDSHGPGRFGIQIPARDLEIVVGLQVQTGIPGYCPRTVRAGGRYRR